MLIHRTPVYTRLPDFCFRVNLKYTEIYDKQNQYPDVDFLVNALRVRRCQMTPGNCDVSKMPNIDLLPRQKSKF